MNNRNYYNAVGTYYDQDANDFDVRYWQNPVLQQIRQCFREKVKQFNANTMLEIGCGTGLDLVHFGKTHPEREIYGIDVSVEMVRISQTKIDASGCTNITVKTGIVDDIVALFPNKKFDLIYVFFGALNTVEDLEAAALKLTDVLTTDGVMVLSFVNKWYLGGMIIELARFRFKRAFARLKPTWTGYSPVKYLPSHCYSPKQIKKAFKALKPTEITGFSIIHPAWYYTQINKRLGKLRRLLWGFDQFLNKTPLKVSGEYTLFVFQR
jgi:ubiquinone/menaquinone biosynthesis C-methylase UbiE